MKKFALIASAMLFPGVAFAAVTDLESLLQLVIGLINIAIPIIISLAVLVFIWGLFMYITNPSEDEKKKEGRDIMIWGVIALFVMFSVFGLVNLLIGTFQLSNATLTAPKIQTPSF